MEDESLQSAESNRVLELIQSTAYAKSEEALVNLKLLQNTSITYGS